VLLQPILKRIFEPEDFGVFDVYLKILGILFVIYAMKYDMGVVLPKNRVKALGLLVLSIIFSVFFTAISILIVFVFENSLIELLGIQAKYSFVLYLLPFSTLFFSLYNTFNYLLIRDKRFVSSAMNKLSRRGVEGGIQIGMGLNGGIKMYGLFVGDIIGNFAYFISAYYQSFRGFKFEKRLFNYQFLKSLAKEYSDLPKYNIIPELLNAGFFAALSFLVLSKFDVRELGFMELTQRILAIPSAFVAYSVGQVLLQRLTEMVNNKQKISEEVHNILYLLLGLTVPFVLITLLFAESIFSFVFGELWIVSGTYAKYLVLFYAIAFLVSPLSQVLISLQEFKINAMWKIGRFVVVLPLFFIELGEIKTYLLSYAILGGVSYIAYLYIILSYANKYDKSIN
jgi:O-antigen/teichoic acid export membrane protein